MSTDPLETFMQEYPTRIRPTGTPHPELLDQLRFAARLMNGLDQPPSGPHLVYQQENVGAIQHRAIEGELSVGRNEKAALALRLLELSSRHFALESSGAGARLRDLGSSNGTFLNSRRIEKPAPLHSGDVIEAGGQLFLYLELD